MVTDPASDLAQWQAFQPVRPLAFRYWDHDSASVTSIHHHIIYNSIALLRSLNRNRRPRSRHRRQRR